MTDFEIEKIINRFAESTNQRFTKIPDEIVTAQKVLRLLEDERKLETDKVKQDKFAIQIIEAKLIGQKRLMTELKRKFKLK